MRGISDRDSGLWPISVISIGVNDVCLFNRLTSEELEREPKRGDYGSSDRKAQNERLEARARELNRELERKAKESGEVLQEEHKPLANPYSWALDTRGEVQPVIHESVPCDDTYVKQSAYCLASAEVQSVSGE